MAVDWEYTAADLALAVAAVSGSREQTGWHQVARHLGRQWDREREAVARDTYTGIVAHRENRALGTLWTRIDQASPATDLSVVWGHQSHQASQWGERGKGRRDK